MYSYFCETLCWIIAPYKEGSDLKDDITNRINEQSIDELFEIAPTNIHGIELITKSRRRKATNFEILEFIRDAVFHIGTERVEPLNDGEKLMAFQLNLSRDQGKCPAGSIELNEEQMKKCALNLIGYYLEATNS